MLVPGGPAGGLDWDIEPSELEVRLKCEVPLVRKGAAMEPERVLVDVELGRGEGAAELEALVMAHER